MPTSILLSEEAEAKLRNIMAIRKLDSLEAAAEMAFEEGERKALFIKDLYTDPLTDEEWGEVFDPNYDLEKLRAMEVPSPPHNDEAVA